MSMKKECCVCKKECEVSGQGEAMSIYCGDECYRNAKRCNQRILSINSEIKRINSEIGWNYAIMNKNDGNELRRWMIEIPD